MKKLMQYICLGSLLFAFGACDVNVADRIKGNFDEAVWKGDANGCNNKRLEMVDAIKAAQEDLVLLGEADIRKVLGKPDKTELFSRSQKFYIYFLEAGGQCVEGSTAKWGKSLEVSLDALGRLHEINVRN
ncbi:MAG: hypothetical protein ACPGJS_19355 [Flammeovirgaceae bacterium]